MKKRKIVVGQYAFETKNLEGASEEFLKKTAPLIGHIVHSFNTLEDFLNSAICQLISNRSDGPGLLVIHKMNYSAKVELFKRFLVDLQNTCEKSITCSADLLAKLTEAGKLRNMVVHAEWESAHDDGYVLCRCEINTKGIHHEYIQFTPESLRKIRILIDETCEMFDKYDEELEELYK